MSDAVVHKPFSVHPSPTTRDLEDADVIRQLRDWFAQSEAIDSWSFSEAEAKVVHVVIEPKVVVSPGPSSLPTDRLLVERDDDGGVIIADPTGAAYGVGSSLGEAFQQWEEGARQHYEDLRKQADSLHLRMRRQLYYLTRLFG